MNGTKWEAAGYLVSATIPEWSHGEIFAAWSTRARYHNIGTNAARTLLQSALRSHGQRFVASNVIGRLVTGLYNITSDIGRFMLATGPSAYAAAGRRALSLVRSKNRKVL